MGIIEAIIFLIILNAVIGWLGAQFSGSGSICGIIFLIMLLGLFLGNKDNKDK